MFKNDFILIINELYFLYSILFILVFSVVLNKIFKSFNISYITGLLALTALVNLFFLSNNLFCFNFYAFNFMLYQNDITWLLQNIIIISSIAFLVILASVINLKNYLNFEYIILVLLALLGVTLLIKSNDLLIMYMALELVSLSLYILASYNKYSNHSVEAGLKYFILGAIVSGILLLGISLVYGFTGLTNFLDLSHLNLHSFSSFYKPLNFCWGSFENVRDESVLDKIVLWWKIIKLYFKGLLLAKGLTLGLSLILVALFFKLAIAPFHIWVPDVYKGAPLLSVYFFSILPKLGVIGLLINLFIINLNFVAQFQEYFNIFIVISWGIGSILALYQTNLKRLLAYSSIVHMGFILLGFSLSNISSIFFYQAIYLLLLINVFSFLLLIKKSNKQDLSSIFELTNLYKLNPYLAWNLCFLLFSFSGIPPLAGFFGKFYIFNAAINSGCWGLTLIGLLFSVTSAFYYLRLVKLIFAEYKNAYINYKPIKGVGITILSLSLYLNLVFFLNPMYLTILVESVLL